MQRRKFTPMEMKTFGSYLRKEVINQGKKRFNNLDPEIAYSLDELIENCNMLYRERCTGPRCCKHRRRRHCT